MFTNAQWNCVPQNLNLHHTTGTRYEEAGGAQMNIAGG
jgi:hypothetical protein